MVDGNFPIQLEKNCQQSNPDRAEFLLVAAKRMFATKCGRSRSRDLASSINWCATTVDVGDGACSTPEGSARLKKLATEFFRIAPEVVPQFRARSELRMNGQGDLQDERKEQEASINNTTTVHG